MIFCRHVTSQIGLRSKIKECRGIRAVPLEFRQADPVESGELVAGRGLNAEEGTRPSLHKLVGVWSRSPDEPKAGRNQSLSRLIRLAPWHGSAAWAKCGGRRARPVTAISSNAGTTPAWESKLMSITAADSIPSMSVYICGDQVKHASGDEEAKFPNATLHIILELVSWETVSEFVISKKVIKKVLQVEGYERPNEGDVTVELIGKLQDGKEFLKVHGEREGPCEFNIDAEQVVEELDKVVVTMKKGEIALVIILSEYAVGALEAQQKWIMEPPD
ncbi:hypothetical protein ACLB2K_066157 [Fragaria x ananassa]